MSFLISNAYAEAAQGTATQPDSMFSMIMIAVIFVLFYFMLIRPQNKRAKEHRDMVSQLKKGDEVVTSGGILGKIMELNDQFIKISLAEGVDVMVQRAAVSAILPKGTIKSL